MRMVRNMAAALVALACTTSAFGSVQVWYSATGLNPQSTVSTGVDAPGPLKTLKLECDTSSGAVACSWAITMNAEIAGGLTGWGTDLGTLNGQTSVSNPAAPAGNPFPAGNTFVGTPGNLANLLTGSFAFATSGPFPTGSKQLLTFTLTRNMAANELAISSIVARHGGDWGNIGAEADANGYDIAVRYGPSSPLNGSAFDDNGDVRVGNQPVITIKGVPEPSSIALLALASAAVLRRRR